MTFPLERDFLRGRRAIVTGASRGIGEAIAMALARFGCNVLVTARSADGLSKVAANIEALGGCAAVAAGDLADDAFRASLVPAAEEQLGGLDILINNAGLGVYGPVCVAREEDWDRVMGLNARAPFFLCRDAIPHLRDSEFATIINIASVVGIKGYVNQALYTASKHAMMGYTKVLAQEVAEAGIRVHAICPGGVDTDMAGAARPDLDKSILMQPEEIAEYVLFLLAMRGSKAVLDDVHLRRASGAPWF